MNTGRIFATGLESNTNVTGSRYGKDLSNGDNGAERNSDTRRASDLRSIVQRRFMRMMEAHDRVRAKLLKSS